MEAAIEYDLSQALLFYLALWVVTGLAIWVAYQFLLKILKILKGEE
jgi:hypothetical protein